MKRFLPFIIIAAVLVVAVLLAWVLLRSSQQAGKLTNVSTQTADSEPPGAQPPHLRGNANAPVTLEEFGDFQCPTCGVYYGEVKKIEDEFGHRLRVIFREFPL
ncbi:MAG TPA: thioredoxin domain-containing protein, partial [Candidatus Udaeobacter sp.]